jgi:type I restriction enzyme M protein
VKVAILAGGKGTRLWRGEEPELIKGSLVLLKEHGLTAGYVDVPGLCKTAILKEIEAHGWSLNPGRYVGASARHSEEEDFRQQLGVLQEELERLTAQARELEGAVSSKIAQVLEGAS